MNWLKSNFLLLLVFATVVFIAWYVWKQIETQKKPSIATTSNTPGNTGIFNPIGDETSGVFQQQDFVM